MNNACRSTPFFKFSGYLIFPLLLFFGLPFISVTPSFAQTKQERQEKIQKELDKYGIKPAPQPPAKTPSPESRAAEAGS